MHPKWQISWGQHGAHLGPVGPRWAPCWPHEPCYQGMSRIKLMSTALKLMQRNTFDDESSLVPIMAWWGVIWALKSESSQIFNGVQKSYISVHGYLLWNFKGTLYIPRKLWYHYIERCAVYWDVKFLYFIEWQRQARYPHPHPHPPPKKSWIFRQIIHRIILQFCPQIAKWYMKEFIKRCLMFDIFTQRLSHLSLIHSKKSHIPYNCLWCTLYVTLWFR